MKDYSLSDCIKEAEELEQLYLQLLDTTEESVWNECLISKETKPVQREILRRYEIWFVVCNRIVHQYSMHTKEFEQQYGAIKNLISLKMPNSNSHRRPDLETIFIASFDIQVNILHTIEPIISVSKSNYQKKITADLIDSELEEAEWLYDHDFLRPAGMVAGLILERYLKTLCDVNGITVLDKDSINPLATKLYKSDKLPDFDSTIFKSIQHLADIRNKCSHPKEDPKSQEIRELLDKVKKITFLGL